MTGGPRVKLFELWQRTSAQGNRYLAGWLGNCGVVAFLKRDADLREGVEAIWEVYLQEKDEDRRPRAAAAEAQRPASKRSNPIRDEPSPGYRPSGPSRRRGNSARLRGDRESPSGQGVAQPLSDPIDDIGASGQVAPKKDANHVRRELSGVPPPRSVKPYRVDRGRG